MSNPVYSSDPKAAASTSSDQAVESSNRQQVRNAQAASPRELRIGEKRPWPLQSSLIEPGFCNVGLTPDGEYPAPTKQSRLRNNMLWGLGFLELANAGDFGANVFNEVPVPVPAIVLMALGATFALLMLIVVVRDGQLTRVNLRLLWRERTMLLREQKALALDNLEKSSWRAMTVKAQLDVNFRETGSEVVDRLLVDILMGLGCLLVGTGTFLAIAGANPVAYKASNLLSGYIGNTPAAIYAVINATWSIWIWIRAQCHRTEIFKGPAIECVSRIANSRIPIVQRHATISGITVVVAGAASLVTATKWEGYIPLLPCIISSIWINHYWRHKIAYERPLWSGMIDVSKPALITELDKISLLREKLESFLAPDSRPTSEAKTLTSVVELIVSFDLFEQFCLRLHKHKLLWASIILSQEEHQDIFSAHNVLQIQPQNIPLVNKIAYRCLKDLGLKQMIYRERYIIELLGAYTFEWKLANAETDSMEQLT